MYLYYVKSNKFLLDFLLSLGRKSGLAALPSQIQPMIEQEWIDLPVTYPRPVADVHPAPSGPRSTESAVYLSP
jgi:hypothetical protein